MHRKSDLSRLHVRLISKETTCLPIILATVRQVDHGPAVAVKRVCKVHGLSMYVQDVYEFNGRQDPAEADGSTTTTRTELYIGW
jgi:hypothetical protein